MRTWVQTWDNEGVFFGLRDDGNTFYVDSAQTQVSLDTFLRDDCTCSVDGPRCDFHKEVFEKKGEEAIV